MPQNSCYKGHALSACISHVSIAHRLQLSFKIFACYETDRAAVLVQQAIERDSKGKAKAEASAEQPFSKRQRQEAPGLAPHTSRL